MTFDFNDAAPQTLPGSSHERDPPAQFDFKAINERLQDNLFWVEDLFPRGRLSPDRRYWCMADWSGRAPSGEGSCRIDLMGDRAGWGYDFSTGEGHDPIGVIGCATGLAGMELFREAARIAGMDAPARPRRPPAKKRDPALDIAHILAGTEALAGTVGERYLHGRGLTDPQSPDLLFHPDLTDFDTKRGYCGLVAIVRDVAGKPMNGIHRSFLLDDGSGKAAPGKKMLGDIKGGVVRLARIGVDGHVGIAEGIETALSATAIFSVPCWAALSDGGVKAWQWPAEVCRVTLFADAGESGMQAAFALAERLRAASVPYEIYAPLYGDDFNDDLQRGARREDYAPTAMPSQPQPQLPAVSGLRELEAAARAFTKPGDTLELGKFIGALVKADLEPLAERQLLALVKKHAGVDIGTLREQVRLLKRRVNAGGDVDGQPIKPPWAHLLRKDMLGQPERNEANVITALSNDAAFAGALMFDEFRSEVMIRKPLPWESDWRRLPRAWTDADDVRCAEWLQRREINVAVARIAHSVQAAAREITLHPVREYLSTLEWDRRERLEAWTLVYLGADDTALNRAFGALWMISAVARVMRPGCKVDHMLILEGPQGLRKSTALNVLAGDEWFTDDLEDVSTKDAKQQLRGVWIVEIAELDAISRADVRKIKAFLSRKVDRYRPPYGRYVIDVPRQCVFAGSVNPDTYLRDETGNRRFWPVWCKDIDLDALRRDRDQLWAEAVARFEAGAMWWLTDPELIELAKGEQAARFEVDAWDDRIDRWLHFEGVHRRFEPLDDVAVSEILQHAIGLEAGRWSRADQMRVSSYLKRNGWERYQFREGGARAWRYRNPLSPSHQPVTN